jgi:hypothetical protein
MITIGLSAARSNSEIDARGFLKAQPLEQGSQCLNVVLFDRDVQIGMRTPRRSGSV